MKCLLIGRTTTQYEEAVRKFAFTLHYYSPRAYNFLRFKFNKHLPDVSTIRNWVSNSTEGGLPGINLEAVRAVQNISNEMKKNGKEFFCSLALDEVYIQRHVTWSEAQKKFLGFITYGRKDENGELPVANQALVFLLTGINVEFSIPMAYFFIKSLKADEKSILIMEIIKTITLAGGKVINVTFDGYKNNFAAVRLLGAVFRLPEMKPYFMNPIDGTKIHVILDPCHMLKLIRNCLGTKKMFQYGDEKIEWVFFERLESCRVNSNFVTHKLTKKHIQWHRNKMNVKLAAQTFSDSVANSMEYLEQHNHSGFEGCGGTVKFNRTINNLFDIFNSKKPGSNKIFKNPLCRTSAQATFAFLDEAMEYLKYLKIGGVDALNCERRTGIHFLLFWHREIGKMIVLLKPNKYFSFFFSFTDLGFKGFVINIMSLKSIYDLYVKSDIITQLPTYLLSQDSLESFFSRVRSLNGNSDNPPVTQFISAFRKILLHNEVTSAESANCADNLKLLTVSSQPQSQMDQENLPKLNIRLNPDEDDFEFLLSTTLNENDFLIHYCEEATIASIAGSIEEKIIINGRFECQCKFVLQRNIKVIDLMTSENVNAPCISTLYICKVANALFNLSRNKINFDYDFLIDKIMLSIDVKNVYQQFFKCDLNHKIGFVQYIVGEFIRLHATYIAKNVTLAEQKFMCRKVLKKRIHFLGQ